MNKGDIAALKASGIIYRIVDERHDEKQYIETIKYFDSTESPFEVEHTLLVKDSRALTEKEKKRFPAEGQFWAG